MLYYKIEVFPTGLDNGSLDVESLLMIMLAKLRRVKQHLVGEFGRKRKVISAMAVSVLYLKAATLRFSLNSLNG